MLKDWIVHGQGYSGGATRYSVKVWRLTLVPLGGQAEEIVPVEPSSKFRYGLSDNSLYLLKPIHRNHKDGGTFFALGGGGAGFMQDLDGGIHLLGLQADQQGRHATPQQAPGGGDAL